jgi:16S rRNA (cytosine967-C5)-methyltransferase
VEARLAFALRLEALATGPGDPATALAELARQPGACAAPRLELPAWVAADLPEGLDPMALALACLRPPSLWLRAPDEERLREGLGELAAGLVAHPRMAGAWRLEAAEDLYATAGFQRGDFVLQDPASQAIGQVCAARPGEHWLDLCAGAGGKSLLLAETMTGKGLVHALDIHLGRLDELRRRARRQQVFNLRVQAWDGRRLPPLPPMDGVLVDAPCSASGTLRRNPDLWQRPAPDLAGLCALQESLLERGAARLRPGGRLVYATCSLLRQENEERVAAFLTRHPDFAPLPFDSPLDGRPCDGRLRITPLEHDGDGTFVACFLRK